MMTETVREESTMSVITQISLTDTETGGSSDLEDKSDHFHCGPTPVRQSGPLSLVQITRDTLLSLVEPYYYAGAKVYAITK